MASNVRTKPAPRIIVPEKRLTVLIGQDDDQYSVYCPELDLVTEMKTPEAALEDMLDAMKDYAEEYLDDLELYSRSPNRAHHLPYIQAIAACKTEWELRTLVEVRYGVVHV